MIKKKLVLEWEYMRSGNYLLGIVSSSSHLEIVHALNKTGHFNFIRNDDIEFSNGKETIFFIRFSFEDTENESTFKLFKNKGTLGIIGKELKGFDYILVVHSENEDIFNRSKDILLDQKFIQAVMVINTEKLSDKTKKILAI